jgi:Putative peptidoglycan binding domain
MPKLRKQNTRFPGLVQKLGRRNLAIVVAFVLVFAGVGAFYVQRSEAAGSCVWYTFRQGSSGQCVKDVQYELVHLGYGNMPIDGIYGPLTASEVSHFGFSYAGINNSGQVGSRTWSALCRYKYAFPWIASNEGCK